LGRCDLLSPVDKAEGLPIFCGYCLIQHRDELVPFAKHRNLVPPFLRIELGEEMVSAITMTPLFLLFRASFPSDEVLAKALRSSLPYPSLCNSLLLPALLLFFFLSHVFSFFSEKRFSWTNNSSLKEASCPAAPAVNL